MSQLYPLGLLPWIELRFGLETTEGYVPNANGFVSSVVAGTSTPLETYTDVNGTTANPTTIQLDPDGRPPDPIFLLPQGYDFLVYDSNNALQYTIPGITTGQSFAATFGNVLATGATNVSSGYTTVVSDRLVTVSSTGGPNPCIINLMPAVDATQPLTIKNLGTVALAVTPNGSDAIDTLNAAFTVSAASSPSFPSILLASDGISSWWILASHGL